MFRQGDRPTAFYVVRSGVLEVIEEDPDTGEERQIRTLVRGESFGELGLLMDAPRAATIRAVEEAEVFEVDQGTFDHLLADMIHVPEFEPTLQQLAEPGLELVAACVALGRAGEMRQRMALDGMNQSARLAGRGNQVVPAACREMAALMVNARQLGGN